MLYHVISCYILAYSPFTNTLPLWIISKERCDDAMLRYARGVQNHKHCLQHRDQAHALKKGSKLQDLQVKCKLVGVVSIWGSKNANESGVAYLQTNPIFMAIDREEYTSV